MRFESKKYFILILSLITLLSGCTNSNSIAKTKELVIYTSVDQNIAEPIFNDFEKETGISVKAVYDIEASKTTGLSNRLIAEKNNPQADVFWSSEIIMTLKLKEENVFQLYISNESKNIPSSYKDTDGYWTGFGGRARVMIINTEVFEGTNYPDSVYDLTDSKYSNYKKVIAYPLFGTSMTHMFIMNQLNGEANTVEYYKKALDNNTILVDGNSVVRDLVANGEAAFGITDTDDALAAVKDNKPVKVFYLNQKDIGTLVIPNTVGLINNCINSEEGMLFIDYLLSKTTEDKLIEMGFIDVSLNNTNNNIVFLECNFEDALRKSDSLLNNIKDLLVR